MTREARKIGRDVWVFRWREPDLNGQKRNRKALVGTIEEFRTESLAMKAVEGLRLEINKEIPGAVINSVTFGELVAHYQEKELPEDMTQAKVPKAYSTAVTYRRYLRKGISPR